MDSQIKKRLKQDIIVYSLMGTVDGDKSFASPITLKGFGAPKYQIITDRMGNKVEVKATVILSAEDMYKIKDGDEISTPFILRTPVKSITPYQDLKNSYELIEVYL